MTAARRRLRSGELIPPTEMRSAVGMIHTLIASHDPTDGDFYDQALTDGADSLISILGRRGSGKSTLLAAVCADVERQKSAIVLPTLRPDVFEATDSLLLAMLIEIEGWFSNTGKPSPDTDDLSAHVADAIRSVSVSSRGAFHALETSRESAGQYGIDAAAIVRHRRRQTQTVAQVFRSLRAHLKKTKDTPILVPIDDADLSPGNLNAILSAVRLLGGIDKVLPIICADRQQLEIAVRSEIVSQHGGHIGDESAMNLANQVVAKLLRPERCFSPPVLPKNARGNFAPLGEAKSIYQLLRNARTPSLGSQGLDTIIWEESAETRGRQPEFVNDWLPETPRELEYLWHAISDLTASLDSSSTPVRVQRVQRLIQHMLANTNEYSVRVEPIDLLTNGRRGDQDLKLRWPRLNYGIAALGRWVPAVSNAELRLEVRKLGRIRTGIRDDIESSEERSRPLSAAGISSVQAIQQLSYTGVLGEVAPGSDPSYVGEVEFEFLQQLTILGLHTDDFFMTMPDSCGVQAITRGAVAWNQLVETARGYNRSFKEAGASATIRRYIHLVCGYWFRGDIRVLTSKRVPALGNVMDTASMLYLRNVRRDEVSHHERYSVEQAYCNWFEQHLPFIFHTMLLGERHTQAAVHRWLDAISAGPRAVEATADLRSSFEARFVARFEEERRKKDGAQCWIFGYELIARNIGVELHADILTLKEMFEERRRSRAVGRDLLGDSVGLSTSKGPYKYAPHRTVEGDEEMAVLREVLEQYRSR